MISVGAARGFAPGLRATSVPRPSEPFWCSDHYEPSSHERLHQHDFKPTWGHADEQVRVGVLRYDTARGAGLALVDVQYLPEGSDVDGSARLVPAEAYEFAGMVAWAAVTAEKPTLGRVGFFMRAFYKFGRALIAASISANACSPRTASSSKRFT